MTPLEWVTGSGIVAAALAAMASRRPSYSDIIKRLADVEKRVDTLEKDLTTERLEHARTWDKLLAAWRYIRETMAWREGPRLTDLPAPPPEVVRDLT